MSEDKMRDTLDLTQLAAEIEAVQERARQRQTIRRLAPRVMILLSVGALFAVALGLQAGNIRFVDQVRTLLQVMLFGYFIYLLTMTLLEYMARRNAVRQSQPIVERLTPLLGFALNLREPLPIGTLLLVTIVLTSLILTFTANVLAFVVLAILFVFALYRLYWPRIQTAWMLWGPFARADYEAAVNRADRLHRLNQWEVLPPYFKSFVLFTAGRLDAMEAATIQSIRRAQHTVNTTYWCSAYLGLLANVQMERSELNEAMRFLEAAAHIAPHEVGSYFTLAELYLIRGDDPERALELLDFGLSRLPEFPATNRNLERSSRASWKLVEAQACWLTGRTTRCNAAVELALELIDPRHLPLTADAYVNLGKLRHLQGETAEAREYGQKALTLDPNGLSGQRARKLLDQLDNPSSAENPPAVR